MRRKYEADERRTRVEGVKCSIPVMRSNIKSAAYQPAESLPAPAFVRYVIFALEK